MQALRDFWARSLLNKAVVLTVVFLVCCCPIAYGQNGRGSRGVAAAPTTVPAATAAPVATEVPAAPTAVPAGYVAQAQYGEAWPFTVAEGVMRCLPGRLVVLEAGGETYAINGTARDSGRFRDLDEVWKTDEDSFGLRINVQPFVDLGLSLCD